MSHRKFTLSKRYPITPGTGMISTSNGPTCHPSAAADNTVRLYRFNPDFDCF